MPYPVEHIAVALKTARKDKKLSQTGLGSRVGLPAVRSRAVTTRPWAGTTRAIVPTENAIRAPSEPSRSNVARRQRIRKRTHLETGTTHPSSR